MTKTKTKSSKQGKGRPTKKNQGRVNQRGYTNVPVPNVRYPQHVRTGLELSHKELHDKMVCNHAKSFSDALANPKSPPPDAKVPLSGDVGGIPCSSTTVPRYSITELTVPASRTTLNIWGLVEGVPVDAEDIEMSWQNANIATATGIVSSGMGQETVEGTALAGICKWAALPAANRSFAIPTTTDDADVVALSQNSVAATYPTTNDTTGGNQQTFRVVCHHMEVAFSGRQQNIEGKCESMCLYEFPTVNQNMNSFETDLSRRVQVFDAKRKLSIKYWPNCQTTVWRDINARALPSGAISRMRAQITDLEAGDKLTIQTWTTYEIVRPSAIAAQTPSPLSRDDVHLRSAIPTFAGRDHTLHSHMVAHKILTHPVLSRVRKLAEAALGVAGGVAAAVGGARLAMGKLAAEVGSFAAANPELAAPLLLA